MDFVSYSRLRSFRTVPPGFGLRAPTLTTKIPKFHIQKRKSKRKLLLVQTLAAQGSASLETNNDANQEEGKEESKVILSSETTLGKETQPRDDGIVFVAGATGKVGSRTVRELLKCGYSVRAGTRTAKKADALLQNWIKAIPHFEGTNPSASLSSQVKDKIEIVICDLEKQSAIETAIGNAGVVACCIGASEKEVSDITGPYRIDYQATKNLIEAATLARINHFILVTSLGTTKFGFPAALLNLFWGVLLWKQKAEEALISSGLTYTIVRPGGMERPTDSYKETHNLVLAPPDTYFGGQVSNLQVAELIACMVRNQQYCKNKIVEVIAETTAPRMPIEELLARLK